MGKTLMDPQKQAVLEELDFNFREIQGQQTQLDSRAEEIIYNKLAEADVAISELEHITEDDVLIAHAMIYVINGSLGQLYQNVVEDISNRIKRFMSGKKPGEEIANLKPDTPS
jgi:chaperonin cofactor prefoldin